MKIIFSEHALEQLKERKIPKKHVLETVKNPQLTLKSYRNRELRQKVFSGKILEAVVYEQKDAVIIITEYLLEKEETNED